MRTSIKSYFALVILILIGVLMIAKISKEETSTTQPQDLCAVLVDLNQVLSYSTSMPGAAHNHTFDLSNKNF